MICVVCLVQFMYVYVLCLFMSVFVYFVPAVNALHDTNTHTKTG